MSTPTLQQLHDRVRELTEGNARQARTIDMHHRLFDQMEDTIRELEQRISNQRRTIRNLLKED